MHTNIIWVSFLGFQVPQSFHSPHCLKGSLWNRAMLRLIWRHSYQAQRMMRMEVEFVCLLVCLFVCLYIYLFIYSFIYLFIYLLINLFIYLSIIYYLLFIIYYLLFIYLFIYLLISFCLYLSIYLFIYLFVCLFLLYCVSICHIMGIKLQYMKKNIVKCIKQKHITKINEKWLKLGYMERAWNPSYRLDCFLTANWQLAVICLCAYFFSF